MIRQADSDLCAYQNERLRTKKSEQQTNTLWFLTPGNPWKPEYHIPIQTQTLKELCELKEKEKLNPQENTESRTKLIKRFDWTHTFLTET